MRKDIQQYKVNKLIIKSKEMITDLMVVIKKLEKEILILEDTYQNKELQEKTDLLVKTNISTISNIWSKYFVRQTDVKINTLTLEDLLSVDV